MVFWFWGEQEDIRPTVVLCELAVRGREVHYCHLTFFDNQFPRFWLDTGNCSFPLADYQWSKISLSFPQSLTFGVDAPYFLIFCQALPVNPTFGHEDFGVVLPFWTSGGFNRIFPTGGGRPFTEAFFWNSFILVFAFQARLSGWRRSRSGRLDRDSAVTGIWSIFVFKSNRYGFRYCFALVPSEWRE